MTDNLSSRMLVNALGIPGILAVVYLGRYYFAIFVTIVCLLALREFYLLLNKKSVFPHITVGLIACLIITGYYYQGSIFSILPFSWEYFLILLTLIILMVELFHKKENPAANISSTIAGVIYIPVLLGTLIALRQIDLIDYSYGMRITMSLFFAVWVCDSAAYAFGKKWGVKKILPRVSPKKSVVGTVAGLIFAILLYLILLFLGFFESSDQSHSLSLLDVITLGIIVGVFGQIGDFVESLIKRDVGVKDSSRFLPGHGGVFDRFDSLLVASPLAYLYLKSFVY